MSRTGENIRKRVDGRWEGRHLVIDPITKSKKYHSVYSHSYKDVKEKLIYAKSREIT